MKKALVSFVVTGLLSMAATAHAQGGLVVTHHERLETFEFVTGGRAAAGQQKAGAAAVRLSFDALGRRYDLDLEPNGRLLSDTARARLRPGVAVYRGQVAGLDGSWVRLVVADGVPRGVIWDGSEMLAIEAPGDSAVAASVPVIYRLKDTYVVPGTMSCGTDRSAGSGAAAYRKLVGELSTATAQAAAADLRLDLGVVSDFPLFERFGSNAAQTEEAILTRLNTVDGIYTEQLGVQIYVAELDIKTSAAGDPFSETDSELLLDEVSDYRLEGDRRARGLTHLYTGRNLDTQTVGIAYVNGLCSPRFGVGLSEGRGSALTGALIAAHEIGHNFGAEHDGEADSVCEDAPPGFLMEASVNGSDQFSQCSIDTITPRIALAQCIAASPTVDVSIAASGAEEPLLLGADAALTFTASNAGTQSATGVAIDVDLPDNVTFLTATTEFGTCTSGAGTVSCTYGTVPGNGERSVMVTLTAAALGSDTLTATVSADTDVDPGNDSQTITLTVDPAVDLVVSSAPVARTEVGEAVNVAFGLENRSILDASAVEMSIALGAGLRADAASWPLGECTVTDRQVDCTGAVFDAQSDVTLDLTLAGVTNGAVNYTLSLTSAEAEANELDNSVTATVQVGPVSMPGTGSTGGGGGGATGPAWLLLLAASAAFRHRRRAPASANLGS